MTAKERLRERIEALNEHEAEQALRLLEMRADPMILAFMDAPFDDEPVTPEEEASLEESRAQHRRGESVPLDEIRHEFS
jgi:LmbE family N-acetylglucosaminyl deacetylase